MDGIRETEEASETDGTLEGGADDEGNDVMDVVPREFCKRESIYGFGDLHVKRLFDKIKNNSNPQ